MKPTVLRNLSILHVLGILLKPVSHLTLERIPINSLSVPNCLVLSGKNLKFVSRLQFKPKPGKKTGLRGFVKSMLLLKH